MAMDPATAAGAVRFTIGRVLSDGFSVLFRNLLRFLVIEVVVAIPLGLIAALATVLVTATVTVGGDQLISVQAQSAIAAIFAVFFFFLFLLGYFMAQAAMTWGALQTLRGTPAGIGACLAQAFRVLPRVFGAGLLFYLALGVILGGAAFLLFMQFNDVGSGTGVAAAIIVFVVALILVLLLVVLWWVFIPAIVMERAGPIACFGRSRALTKGHRWGVLAIVLLIAFGNGMFSTVTKFVRNTGAATAADIIDLVTVAFFLMVTATLTAVGYYLLRGEKEGVAIDDVVKVFD